MIYFDNAATTFPKPRYAIEEAERCMRTYGGNAGRGSHRLALLAAERIYTCREQLASLFGVGAPERVIFTQSATYALNLALKGLLSPGDGVLHSELEHNAVVRPLHALQNIGVTAEAFPVVGLSQRQLLDGIEALIKPETKLLVCTHASNICSLSLPLAEIGALCRRRGLLFVVDAAQSAGHLPIDMQAMHIDALAAPGHKGLLGLQGCGVLALGAGVLPRTMIEGGSGVDSRLREMPEALPERLEAGTLPLTAIAALSGGLSFLSELGLDEVESRQKRLFLAARERLHALGGIEIYQEDTAGAVLLFQKRDVDATTLATLLDRQGICVRAGLHCAPLAHKALGTPPGGAVRLSFGVFNTEAELDALWQALKEM